MYGNEKSGLRLKALEKMKRDKPMLAMKSRDEMEVGEEGESGLITMPVSKEEREMILAMRKKMGMGEEMPEGEMEEEAPEYV